MVRSAKHYVFTINNFLPNDWDIVRDLTTTAGAVYTIAGRETGANGTPHIQGFVSFDRRRTFDFVRNALGGRAHVEVKRGTVRQAVDYCKKDGDFEEWGEVPEEAGKRTDLERYKEWLATLDSVPSEREIAQDFTALWFRYKDRCLELATMICPAPVLEDGESRAWQQALIEALQEPAPPRDILFYVDPEGNSGKSWCVRKLLTVYPDRVQVLGNGRKTDLAYSVDVTKDIFVFDIHRGGMEFLQYGILENLKDRVIYSTKYESKMKVLRVVPHVVVFCNEAPDLNKMTLDRYNLVNYQ